MQRNGQAWNAIGPAELGTIENGIARSWLVSAWPLSGGVPELGPGIYDLPLHPDHSGSRERCRAELTDRERRDLASAAAAQLDEGTVRVRRLGRHDGEPTWTAASVDEAYRRLAQLYREEGYRPDEVPDNACAFATRAQAETIAAALRENATPAKRNGIRIAEAKTGYWIYRQDPLDGTRALGWEPDQAAEPAATGHGAGPEGMPRQ